LKREIRRREATAAASLVDLRHTLQVIRQGEQEAERAKKISSRPTSGWSSR